MFVVTASWVWHGTVGLGYEYQTPFPSLNYLLASMSKPWLLVSPASRGIGLQLARCLLETTDLPVVATARKDLRGTSEQILDGLDVEGQRLEVLNVDVTGTRISFNVYILIDLLH